MLWRKNRVDQYLSIKNFEVKQISIKGSKSFLQVEIQRDNIIKSDGIDYIVNYEMIRIKGRWLIDQLINKIWKKNISSITEKDRKELEMLDNPGVEFFSSSIGGMFSNLFGSSNLKDRKMKVIYLRTKIRMKELGLDKEKDSQKYQEINKKKKRDLMIDLNPKKHPKKYQKK